MKISEALEQHSLSLAKKVSSDQDLINLNQQIFHAVGYYKIRKTFNENKPKLVQLAEQLRVNVIVADAAYRIIEGIKNNYDVVGLVSPDEKVRKFFKEVLNNDLIIKQAKEKFGFDTDDKLSLEHILTYLKYERKQTIKKYIKVERKIARQEEVKAQRKRGRFISL